MIHDEEFDLLWADKPPGWLENIGLMKEIWGNPVFQRRYVLWRLLPYFGVKKSFMIGLIVSLILNILFIIADSQNDLSLGLLVTVVAPGIVVVSITGIRFFTSCLIATPMELKNELQNDVLGAVMTSPISDGKIFIAECMAGIMRGLGAFEEIFAMVSGLLLPFLVVHGQKLLEFAGEVGISTLWWIVLGLLIIAIILILNVMAAFAVALYSILLPIGGAVVAALVHVGSILFLNLAGFDWVLRLLYKIKFVQDLPPLVALLLTLLLTAIFLVISLSLFTTLTSHLGVLAFAIARRPGYYEPERANSATFLLRSRPDRIRFGREI